MMDNDKPLIESALTEMMAVEWIAREKELYAAWRAGYGFLYVLSSFHMTDLTMEFIPSNDPDLWFRDQRVERYDLRREEMGETAWSFLMEYEP